MISRYDVRMHMDIIPDYDKLPVPELSQQDMEEENKINYERYRSLILNEFNNSIYNSLHCFVSCLSSIRS
jgi:hypothetical protein